MSELQPEELEVEELDLEDYSCDVVDSDDDGGATQEVRFNRNVGASSNVLPTLRHLNERQH